MAWLGEQDSFAVSRIELREETSFGRLPGNVVQIATSDVSKHHARIVLDPSGNFLIEDLGSLNGTFVNGERVTRQELQHGDEIRIGPRHFVFNSQVEESTDDHEVELMTSGSDENVVGFEFDAPEFLPADQLQDVQALRKDYERLRLAHEIAREVSGELDPDVFLPRILDRSMVLLRANRGVILLAEPSGELVPKHVRQSASASTIPISRTILAKAISERKAVLTSDLRLDERFSLSSSVSNMGMRSSMTVPLLHGDLLLGAIHLDSTVFANSFQEKDLDLLMVIAWQAATALQNAQLAAKLQHEARTRSELQRLIPPNVVEQVVSGELSLDRAGKRSQITMLYADIRGFTAMCERTEPEEVVRMLNEYYGLMVDVVFRSRGAVDKFVGDQIIALFGAPIESAEAPIFAVHCALEMQRTVEEWNRRRVESGLEPIHIGVAVNSGEVITGAVGASRTLQYTAIGDAMNTAARICELAGANEILVTRAVYSRVKQFVDGEERRPVELRGKRDPLALYRIIGPRVSLDRTV